MNIDISSKVLKDKMIEVVTKLTYSNKLEEKNKTFFEIQYASIVTIQDDKIQKKELEKIILCDLQIEIYPKLEEIFLKILRDAGLQDLKFEKKIDFKDLYNKKYN